MSILQGSSEFYVLKNNCVLPKPTGASHWLEYLPGYMYCFLPSFEAEKGTVKVYSYLPEIVRDFCFAVPIENNRKGKSQVKGQHEEGVGEKNSEEQVRQAEPQHIAEDAKKASKARLTVTLADFLSIADNKKTTRNLRKNCYRAKDRERTNLMNPSQKHYLSAEPKKGLFRIKCSNLFSVLEPEAIDESETKCNELIIEEEKKEQNKNKKKNKK